MSSLPDIPLEMIVASFLTLTDSTEESSEDDVDDVDEDSAFPVLSA